MTDRQALATEQAALVRALVAGGPAPGGFDAERIRAQVEALHAKRRRATERARPDLVRELGPAFPAKFAEWAQANPPRTGTCGGADAAAFAEWALRTSRRRWRPAPRAGARPARP